MPIKRAYAKSRNHGKVWSRLISMAIDAVREYDAPLSDSGWKNLLSKELEIDIETSTRLFEELITKGVLSFVRLKGKRTIYINDRTPDFKKYSWSGDLQYG